MSDYTKTKNYLFDKADKLTGKKRIKALEIANNFVAVYGQPIKRKGGGLAKRGLGKVHNA